MHRLQVRLKAGGYQSKIFCLVPELEVRPKITGLLAERKNVQELREPYRIVATVNEYKMPCCSSRRIFTLTLYSTVHSFVSSSYGRTRSK